MLLKDYSMKLIQRNLMKNEEYGRAIKEIEAEVADVQAALALQELVEFMNFNFKEI